MRNPESDLPIDDVYAAGERASVLAAKNWLEPTFIFRDEPPPDYGVDAHIELRRAHADDSTRTTGRRAWIQIKHAAAPVQLADGSISYPIATRNIRYLGSFSSSFYLLHLPSTGELLFSWHRDVVERLHLDRPNWRDQKEVQIHFRRRADAQLLKEISVEIDSVAEQLTHMQAGPAFIRALNCDGARRLLKPDPIFVGRHREFALVNDTVQRGACVHIHGQPEVGKSEFIRQLLSAQTALDHMSRALGEPLALLHVDLAKRMEPRLLRGIAWALGLRSFRDTESGEAVRNEQAVLLTEELPARAQGQHVLMVLDNIDLCNESASELLHLHELLQSDPLRTGFTFMIGRWPQAQHVKLTRAAGTEISLGPLTSSDSGALVSSLGVTRSLADEAVEAVAALPELLTPGSLRRAAKRFVARAGPGVAQSSDELVDALFGARDDAVSVILESLKCDGLQMTDGMHSPLALFISLSILGAWSVSLEEWSAIGVQLDPATQERLSQVAWLDFRDERVRLTPAGALVFRRELLRLTRGPDDHSRVTNVIANALRRLLRTLTFHSTEESSDALSMELEAAVAWVRQEGLDDTQLGAVLLETLLPLVVDDVFFPVSAGATTRARAQLNSIQEGRGLVGAIAQTVLALRAGTSRADFVACLEAAVDLACGSNRLLAYEIRALDLATRIAEREFRLNRQIWQPRTRLAERLLALTERESRDVGLLKWSASWLLNLAAVAAAIGDGPAAASGLFQAREAVLRLPVPRHVHGQCESLGLRLRLTRIEARMATQPFVRRGKLEEAFTLALQGLAIAQDAVRWAESAFRTSARLSEELATDEQRDELLAVLEQRLADRFGAWDNWPLSLKTQIAAVARSAASCGAEPSQRLNLLLRYVGRLENHTAEAITLAQKGDARALAFLARSFALASSIASEVGDAKVSTKYRASALESSRVTVTAAPSAVTWELYLQLVDDDDFARNEKQRRASPRPGQLSAISDRLRSAMRGARQWLTETPEWTPAEGRLALWCIEREWRSQGSLEIWAAKSEELEYEWDRLRSPKKRIYLARAHKVRLAELAKLERKAGPFLSLCVARVRTEGQFQRLYAIYGNHIPDTAPVLKLINDAGQLWPDTFGVVNLLAQFHRYVWDYGQAIVAFYRLLAMAPRSSDRREATIGLIRMLLGAALFCDQVVLPDGTVLRHDDLIAQARSLLDEGVYFRHVARDVALVRDMVALESGGDVEWQEVERAYETVVGDVGVFATTVIEHSSDLGRPLEHLPRHVSEIVISRYSDDEGLRSLGTLFLRRAELNLSVTPVEDCRKAYACFTACRILEKAWSSSHSESPTTSFQRGRALMVAVTVSQSLLPFALDLEGKRNFAHLAAALFSRAVGLSVGRFHLEGKKRQGEADRMEKLLRTDPGETSEA